PTACTARPATSRIRTKSSTGSPRKAAPGRITRICDFHAAKERCSAKLRTRHALATQVACARSEHRVPSPCFIVREAHATDPARCTGIRRDRIPNPRGKTMIPEPSRLLGEIGISESEEQVYRALLGHRMATAADISRIVGLASRKTQQLLDAIEAKGLVTRSPERPRRYIPISPDIAVEALVRQRQDALDRTRASIQI